MDRTQIIEQLVEATNGARDSGRTQYVFNQDGQWWYSGKLPDVHEFYIAYPNGEFDKSRAAMEITPSDWNEFLKTTDVKFKPAKGKKIKNARQIENFRRILCFCSLYLGRIGLPVWPVDIISRHLGTRVDDKHPL